MILPLHLPHLSGGLHPYQRKIQKLSQLVALQTRCSYLKFVHVIQNFLKGVDPVKLANAKLQSDPGTAALKLMDCVFTTEEMVNSNPSGVTKSKDPTRQKTIKRLDPTKMQYIDGKCIIFTTCIRIILLQSQISYETSGE